MFQINQIQVTDEDIANVEEHFGFRFNDEQKNVIRFWDSTDIQACPGSGKTTTLAAKLMILAEKLPKSFYQGICIITHTNTAVDEIKHKLGSYADFYNNYPHHFGTIQSFVDKYLAIPAYKLKFPNQPIKIVDTQTYCHEMNKCNSLIGTRIIFSQRGIDELGYLSFNIHNFDIAKDINAQKISLNRLSEEKMQEHYDKLKKAKTGILKQGFIKYDEAYSIAFSHLRKHSSLKNLFNKRFPLVFIDEMQDMETHQYKLIQNLFENTSTVIQKIGDINQSIFSSHSLQEKSDWQPTTTTLQLSKTTRLSGHLAAIVKPICLSPQEMQGWQNDNPIPPTLIVFDDNTKDKVKEKFVELIIQHDLLKYWKEDKPFKAVGQRRSEVQNKHLNINSYWAAFSKDISIKGREEFENLFSYLEKCQVLTTEKNIKEIRKTLLNGICKALKLAEIKTPLTEYYFTPFSFTQYFISEQEVANKQLNLNLSKWILNFKNSDEIRTNIANHIRTLLPIFHKTENSALSTFLTDTTFTIHTQQKPTQIYEHQGIQVHFDTIHGVKGETHTATLYLETFKDTFDIGGKILDFIMSSQNRKDSLRTKNSYAACQKKLPLAYVAMSRATHFLCLAVHKDRFGEDIRNYFTDTSNGWSVEFLQES